MKLAKAFGLGFTAVMLVAGPAGAAVVDGTVSGGEYPAPLATQGVQTQFGDASDGLIDQCNGSELDVAYGTIQGGTLFLALTGNLETSFNKIEIFIDSQAGGQNTLRGDNPNVDFDGLNRMGDDGTGNGLTFDAGFESDYFITVTNGDVGGGAYKIFANFAETNTGGGGVGNYLGETTHGVGTLTGGTNPDGIELTINNSNTAGVGGGCDAASGAGVSTGAELAIPLSAIGNPVGCVKVCAFINGSSHDFLANQVLGSLTPTQCNLGEPRVVDFESLQGTQWFEVCEDVIPAVPTTWGSVKTQFE